MKTFKTSEGVVRLTYNEVQDNNSTDQIILAAKKAGRKYVMKNNKDIIISLPKSKIVELPQEDKLNFYMVAVHDNNNIYICSVKVWVFIDD